MLVVLTALSGGAPGRRIQLRTDQVLKVGRSGWADFSVENDATMLDEHFEVRCAPEGCVVRAFSADAPTLVNGEAVASAVVYDGDEIEAGATKFKLTIQGGPGRPAEEDQTAEPTPEESSPESATAVAGAAVGLVGVCALLEFGDDVQPLAEAASSSDQLIDELARQEKFQDAVKLRAYLLEKRQAVWWELGVSGKISISRCQKPMLRRSMRPLLGSQNRTNRNAATRRNTRPISSTPARARCSH